MTTPLLRCYAGKKPDPPTLIELPGIFRDWWQACEAIGWFGVLGAIAALALYLLAEVFADVLVWGLS